MGAVFDDDQFGALYQLGGPLAGRGEGNDSVGIAVEHERRHVDLLEIFTEILVPARHALYAGNTRGDASDIPAGLQRLLADPLSKVHVGVVEVFEKLGEE